ncbi:MAG: glycosyltransferase [Cyanobacteriota bacterium]|nr:glycosyltransferase [Cyanobacteriota bacterium]
MAPPPHPSGLRPLWFLPDYPPNIGGIGTFAQLVGQALVGLGHSPHLLVALGGPSRATEDGVDVIRHPLRDAFEARQPGAVLLCRRWLAALKEELQPDLYHVHPVEPSPLLHLATGAVAPAPMILTLHSALLASLEARDPSALLTRLLEASAIITGVSTAAVRQAAQVRPDLAHRMLTIPNGVPLGEGSPLPSEPRLLAIGRLDGEKGFDRLLRAMPTVLARQPEASLDLVGEGPERPALEALTEALGLRRRVQFHGSVDRLQIPDFLARCRVVVAPSHHEGLPYALLEAGAAGRPVVATRVEGIAQVVMDQQTGILIEGEEIDRDPAVLGEAIASLLADDQRARALAAAGQERVAQHFSLDRCAAAYVQVYRAAMAPEVDLAVIVPAWNGGRHLEQALHSALQEARSVEASVRVLVVDDGSSDDTAAVARRFASDGVELFQQPNGGEALALNAGLALSRSRFVAKLDADDLWPEGRLAALLSVLAAHPELEAAFGQVVEFADPDAPPNVLWTPEPTLVRMPTTGLLRRSAFDRFGGFAAGDPSSTFAWMANALGLGLAYASVDQVVLRRRIHGTNASHGLPFLQEKRRLAQLKAALDARRRSASGR